MKIPNDSDIETPTYVTLQPYFGKYPVMISCPFCHQRDFSRIIFKNGPFTWISMALGGVFLFFVCGCLWPCFSNCFKDIEHRCYHCDSYLATYERL